MTPHFRSAMSAPAPPPPPKHSRDAARRRLQAKRCFGRMSSLLELEKELHGIILDELMEGKDAALQATYDVLRLVFNRLATQRLKSQLTVKPDPEATVTTSSSSVTAPDA